MCNRKKYTLLIFLLLVFSPVHANNELELALVSGQVSMDVRYRYENVQENNIFANAAAFTLRTRLAYQSARYNEFSINVEFENTSAAELGKYNKNYSEINDKEGSEVNQLKVGYYGFKNTDIILGRQEIVYANARFIGNDNWRQNQQTFDALTLVNKHWPDFLFHYAYIENVNSVDFLARGVNAHLFNADYDGFDVANVYFYAYLLDEIGSINDMATVGLSVSGAYNSDAEGDLKFLYTGELAQQHDYADADIAFNVEYKYIELGLQFNDITFTIASETLSGDGRISFETPLANKHEFNGWTDQFSTITPATGGDGLNDIIISLKWKQGHEKIIAVYHDFSADNGEFLGSEFNFLATRKMSAYTFVGFKYADYSAHSWSVDTRKIWLWGELVF